jgi:dephospho-CoA kinase
MIIGLSGYAKVGKDEVAQILVKKYGFKRIAFADPIRELLLEINPILANGYHLKTIINEEGWTLAKNKEEVRRLLQELGVGARQVLGDDVWVVAALRKMENFKQSYVITDVRFENEAVMVRQLSGEIWRIQRPGIQAVNNHVSELEMDGYKFDRVLRNEGTLEELELLIQTRMDAPLHAN